MDATRRYYTAVVMRYLPYGIAALVFIILIWILSGFWSM
jgi:hypothetical protein